MKVILVVLIAGLAACSRGSSPTSGRQPAETPGDEGAAPLKTGAQNDDEPPQKTADGTLTKGITGTVKVLEGEPGGKVIVTLPGTTEPLETAEVDGEGRFEIPDLEPNTYRLIVPADGIHSTADMYVTVGGDAGVAEVAVPRSRGCPVKITVRSHNSSTIANATLDLALSDLEQVPEPHRITGTSNADGELIVVGSCVRGYLKGTMTVPERGEFEINHGYVGTGRDKFDVVLPEKAGEAVSYANDD